MIGLIIIIRRLLPTPVLIIFPCRCQWYLLKNHATVLALVVQVPGWVGSARRCRFKRNPILLLCPVFGLYDSL